MDFTEAFTYFLSYSPNKTNSSLSVKHERKRFKELLCHDKYGLCVYIIGEKYILLRSDDVYLDLFLPQLLQNVTKKPTSLKITKDLLQKVLFTVNTEWDKKVVRFLLSLIFSKCELSSLGVDTHNNTDFVMDAVEEAWLLNNEAEAIVSQRLEGRMDNIHKEIGELKSKMGMNKFNLTSLQLDDLNDNLQTLVDREAELNDVKERKGKTNKLAFDRMLKRTINKLIKKRRIGLRKAGCGRPLSMDENDEQFLVQSIESKTTAHGRRHDTVMYSGRRVKKRDFLKLVNHNRLKRNLKPIKSATTAYNRSRPHNKMSIQASRHIGDGLFCTKKPPKTEKNENDLTHYQRAHKKYIVQNFCTDDENLKYNFEISMDDKAYICPGTGTGMTGARNIRIFQPSDENTARKLPKYDFPVSMVNVVPATYRIMSKEVKAIDGKSVTQIIGDSCSVFMRPKYFLGSSGTIWASEFMKLRFLQPHKFEALSCYKSTDLISSCSSSSSSCYCLNSIEFKSINVLLNDCFQLFIDSSDEKDLVFSDNSFIEYHLMRASSLQKAIWNVFTQFNSRVLMSEAEVQMFESLRPLLDNLHHMLLECIDIIKNCHSDTCEKQNTCEIQKTCEKRKTCEKQNACEKRKNCEKQKTWGKQNTCEIQNTCEKQKEILELLSSILKELVLPPFKSRIFEWTDAGPGVGVSNFEVKFRAAQKVRIMNMDYFVRLHLSNGDSAQNEVERCQGYVGDAIVDGAALNWEHRKIFDVLNAEHFQNLSYEQMEKYELDRMKYNSFKVCEELVSRIDGAPGPGGYLKAYKSDQLHDLFFYDKSFLLNYHEKSEKERKNLPGYFYYSKISNFMDGHFHIGMKYLEYLKDDCIKNDGIQCSFCSSHPWVGPKTGRVPQPYPNNEALPQYHYLHVDDAPRYDREIDDFQPRKNLKSLYELGEISLQNKVAIDAFSNKFLVDPKIIRDSLEHLQLIDIKKRKRKDELTQKKEIDNAKEYDDVDWDFYYDNNKITSLGVNLLNKYLTHHQLNKYLSHRKPEKCKVIMHHIAFRDLGGTQSENTELDELKEIDNIEDDNDIGDNNNIEEHGDSDDEVIDYIEGDEGDGNGETNDNIEIHDNVEDIFVSTRSGRKTYSWAASLYK